MYIRICLEQHIWVYQWQLGENQNESDIWSENQKWNFVNSKENEFCLILSVREKEIKFLYFKCSFDNSQKDVTCIKKRYKFLIISHYNGLWIFMYVIITQQKQHTIAVFWLE